MTEKSLICRKEGIRFTYMADSEKLKALEQRDIYSLFGNALDNAIEAVRGLKTPEKRVINLSVVCSGPFLNIQLMNYYDQMFEIVDGLPKTTKKDRLMHGYGMKSIRMTVEKYDGEMNISSEDNIFELNIVIPLGASSSCPN